MIVRKLKHSLSKLSENTVRLFEFICKSVLAFNTFCKYFLASGFLMDNLLQAFEIHIMPFSLITGIDLSLGSAWGMT